MEESMKILIKFFEANLMRVTQFNSIRDYARSVMRTNQGL